MEVSVESRARERSFGKVVNVNDRDEELALFLEMRRREKDKEKNTSFLLLPNKNADELDAIAAPLGTSSFGLVLVVSKVSVFVTFFACLG